MATRHTLWRHVLMIVFAIWGGFAHAADCIAPARPGGGFDVTCRLLADSLPGITDRFMPGGVGAVAFNAVLAGEEEHALVAFSEGSIRNLVRGAYGPHDIDDVRWLAALALDHGAVTVRADAPWSDLPALLAAAAVNPRHVAFGGGGGVGGLDWRRAQALARLGHVSTDRLRFVAFEGGGGCTEALLQGFVQACLNDVSDSQAAIDDGMPLRIVAVLAPERMEGALAGVATAREQGIALDWPVLRGVYASRTMPEADVWQDRLARLMATPEFHAALKRHHLQPAGLTGPALDRRLARIADDARRTD